jgi:lysyl-tRNA synthetase class 1
MNWLGKIVDGVEKAHPDGEVTVASGVSPSGTYHVGHLREVLTADAVVLELKRRGRNVRHIHSVDNHDALRKVPANVPEEFAKYLGWPLSEIPSPDGKAGSYGEYFYQPFEQSMRTLGVEMEIMRTQDKYREGFFASAIEKTLENIDQVRQILADVSGRQLDPNWTPIQVMEGEYLKNRPFVGLDKAKRTVAYQDKDGREQTAVYDKGKVKLSWRVDWPARWWLLGVDVEPFGRDHATKGGSYDTGVGLVKDVFGAKPPLPVPYNFINRAGDTKKMSASSGTGVDITEVVKVLPPEVVRFFVLRYLPEKTLSFDSGMGAVRLMDEFAALAAKENPDEDERQLLHICTAGNKLHRTVSRVPFSHLVASYQAALKDVDRTLEVISHTEHAKTVEQDKDIIKQELRFIDEWLGRWAPEEVKFSLLEKADKAEFSDTQKQFLAELADKISGAPETADAEWFHKAVYDFKDRSDLSPKELFETLYRVLIGKTSGPRAGLFLSMLPRDWLIKRLKLEG